MKKVFKVLGIIVGTLVVLWVGVFLFLKHEISSNQSANDKVANVAPKAVAPVRSTTAQVNKAVSLGETNTGTPTHVAEKSPIDSHWIYETKEDKMRGTKNFYAQNVSTTVLNLGFPYEQSEMSVLLRNKNGSKDVVVIVKGVFGCNSIVEQCALNVKFDNNPIEKFSYQTDENAAGDAVFVPDYNRFVDRALKAKHMIIETDLFNAGTQQYEFDISGLQWSK